ncbi:MAG: RBBP9/YdeN family alpha/beta hydrolase [Thermoleophilaceae bacterium]
MGDPAGHQEPARVLARRRRELRLAGLSRSFLILHGLEGSGPGHWQTWLAARLREHGEAVRYPDLPEPFEPQPDDWLAVLRTELDALDGERVVLCHSLGCLLWLLHARDGARAAADRVLLVAPPCLREVAAVERFWPEGVTAADVERACPATLMVWSAPDPYCPASAPAAFPGVFPRAIEIPGGGHLNTDAGYGPWPLVEQWALGETG